MEQPQNPAPSRDYPVTEVQADLLAPHITRGIDQLVQAREEQATLIETLTHP